MAINSLSDAAPLGRTLPLTIDRGRAILVALEPGPDQNNSLLLPGSPKRPPVPWEAEIVTGLINAAFYDDAWPIEGPDGGLLNGGCFPPPNIWPSHRWFSAFVTFTRTGDGIRLNSLKVQAKQTLPLPWYPFGKTITLCLLPPPYTTIAGIDHKSSPNAGVKKYGYLLEWFWEIPLYLSSKCMPPLYWLAKPHLHF